MLWKVIPTVWAAYKTCDIKCRFFLEIGVDERERVDKKSDKKMTKEGGSAAKKVMPVSQILLSTLFCN